MTLIEPTITKSELHRKLYCMILAKWIGKEAYLDKDYYYTKTDNDVFEYAFQPEAKNNKAVLRKLAVYQAHELIRRFRLTLGRLRSTRGG